MSRVAEANQEKRRVPPNLLAADGTSLPRLSPVMTPLEVDAPPPTQAPQAKAHKAHKGFQHLDEEEAETGLPASSAPTRPMETKSSRTRTVFCLGIAAVSVTLAAGVAIQVKTRLRGGRAADVSAASEATVAASQGSQQDDLSSQDGIPMLALPTLCIDHLPAAICPPFNSSTGRFIVPGISKSVDHLRRSCSCPSFQLVTQGVQPACNRPHLLLKHFPKAGGSFARGVLSSAVASSALTVRDEFATVGADDWRRHFVIGLLREPCSYYISLFAFGSRHPTAGAFAREMRAVYGKQAAKQTYGQTPPYDGPDDVGRFRQWARRDEVRGAMFGRFLSEYGSEPFVDCWANTANLSATLRSCVQEFVHQGGSVDWDAYAIAEREAHDLRLGSSGEFGINASPHSACGAYYDGDLARAVTLGFDAPVYSQFGFSGCCARKCARCGVRMSTRGGQCVRPSPSPPPPQSPFNDVLALWGTSDHPTRGICITSPTEAHAPDGTRIAAQCCTASGDCRRSTTNSSSDCIAGDLRDPGFIEMTFAEAGAACTERGLVLCERSCVNEGCYYNEAYVWTRLACPSPPPPTLSSPPPKPSPPPPS